MGFASHTFDRVAEGVVMILKWLFDRSEMNGQ